MGNIYGKMKNSRVFSFANKEMNIILKLKNS